jgi:ankyrin repeat protein
VSNVIELLLRRGADPSLSSIPYPALCFAVAAGDIKIVRLLLEKGADCNRKMPSKVKSYLYEEVSLIGFLIFVLFTTLQ